MESLAIYRYQPAAYLRVTDEDAADFLQSQFSNELRPFEAGHCVYGLWLNVKGKVVADSIVLCDGDEAFRVFSEDSSGAAIQAQLERHIIADDVVIDVMESPVVFALIGEVADTFWTALGLHAPEAGQFVETADYLVFPGRRSKAKSFEVLCQHADAEARLQALLQEGTSVSLNTLEAEQSRIDAGVPKVPQEIGLNDLPGEGGLIERAAVSLTKGCYLGQEVVARMHNLGRPQRGLFVVSGEGAAAACPAALSNDEGKSVGELRTCLAQEDGTWFGVALLKLRFVSVDDVLQMNNRSVRVVRTF